MSSSHLVPPILNNYQRLLQKHANKQCTNPIQQNLRQYTQQHNHHYDQQYAQQQTHQHARQYTQQHNHHYYQQYSQQQTRQHARQYTQQHTQQYTRHNTKSKHHLEAVTNKSSNNLPQTKVKLPEDEFKLAKMITSITKAEQHSKNWSNDDFGRVYYQIDLLKKPLRSSKSTADFQSDMLLSNNAKK